MFSSSFLSLLLQMLCPRCAVLVSCPRCPILAVLLAVMSAFQGCP
jgi:hypothetical protein